MKILFTLTALLFLLAAKGQTPVDTVITVDKTMPIEKPKTLYPDKEYNLRLICYPRYIKREPSLPVDMMVRHYFGISYWD